VRFRTWPVAAVALAGLLVLVVVSLLTASRNAQAVYSTLEELNARHRDYDVHLRRLRSDIHLSSIFMRDYLLDQERERAPGYRRQLTEFRTGNVATLAAIRTLTSDDRQMARLASLQTKLDEYWHAFDPLFDWTPAEKITRSAGFLRREVLPRREAILTIAREIESLNDDSLEAQRLATSRQHAAFSSGLDELLGLSLLLGGVVAVTAVVRLRGLERRSESQRAHLEDAERQMRELSVRLVATQEEERKKLSRELHDHVGQMLTALRLELGRMDRLRSAGDAAASAVIGECRQLVDNMVRIVRDLALGLRPSMLDDFGLQPALEWHVRDFSRRFGIPVELDVKGELSAVPDQLRTCVYRIVQEALTNCARHSRAEHVKVQVSDAGTVLCLAIVDDGIGIRQRGATGGFGLRGISERVRELQGTMSIQSGSGQGTTLSIQLPLPTRPNLTLVAASAGATA
jgi:signal transduction histidine kinase